MVQIASPIWGNIPYEVTQTFGPGYRPDWYQYSADLGLPSGYHPAIDVGVPKGTPIMALNNGRVVFAGWSDSFRPSYVEVETDQGAHEIYGHLWQVTTQAGRLVRRGDQLGVSGEQTVPGTMEPDGSGPHLHFELRVPDASTPSGFRAVDPIQYVRAPGQALGAVPGQSGWQVTAVPMAQTGAEPLDLGSIGGEIANWFMRGLFVILGMGAIGLGLIAVTRGESVGATVGAAARTGTRIATRGAAGRRTAS